MVVIQKHRRGDYTQYEITIPKDIIKAKNWESGDILNFKISENGTIYLEKEK